MSLAPKVTVVIPARDEQRTIGKCLSLVLSQQAKWPFEVIVVDSCSRDRTPEIASSKGARVLRASSPKKSMAVNIGVREARGEIIVVLDADCYPASDRWLASLCKPFRDPEVGVVCGTVLNIAGQKTEKKSLFGEVFWGANMAFRKEAAIKVGLFDESLEAAEDKDFQLRVMKAGYKFRQVKEAEVVHEPFWRMRELVLSQIRHGRGVVSILRRHSDVFKKLTPLKLLYWGARTVYEDAKANAVNYLPTQLPKASAKAYYLAALIIAAASMLLGVAQALASSIVEASSASCSSSICTGPLAQ